MTAQRPIGRLGRIVRYGIAGCIVSVLFSLGIVLFVEVWPRLTPVHATIAMFFLIQPVGYATHRLITFPEPDPPARSWLRFIVTNFGAFAASSGGMAFVTLVLHASYLWGVALNWAIVPGMNFMIYLFWVFRPGRVLVKERI